MKRNLLVLTAVLIAFQIQLTVVRTASAQPPDCSPFAFNLAPEFSTGPNAFVVTAADVTGDGIPDIITPHQQARYVAILNGDGVGGYAPPRVFPTVINLNTVTVGDVNGDSLRDIVVAYSGGNQIAVLLNTGNGQFAAPSVITFPVSAFEIFEMVLGDLNGDSSVDLAMVTANNLVIALGNGQGAFPTVTALPWQGRNSDLVIGNLNGDAIPDLAATRAGGSAPWSFGVVFGNSAGTFSINGSYSLQSQPSDIGVTDVNRDGVTDLVISANYPFNPSIPQPFYAEPWIGSLGTFSAGTRVPMPLQIGGLVLTDIDGDNEDDIGASLGMMFAVAVSAGPGTFANARLWVSPSTNAIAAADSDLDGDDDMLLLRSGTLASFVSVMRNDNGTFPVSRPLFDGGTELAAADLNGDMFLDLITAVTSSFSFTSEIFVALNDQNVGLIPGEVESTPTALRVIAKGDFNGDNLEDIVSGHLSNSRRLAVYLGDGTGNITFVPDGITWTSGIDNLAVADFNSDGRDDVFMVSAQTGITLLGQPNGTFVVSTTVGPMEPFVTPATGDFNEDGFVDVVSFSNNSFTLWIGVGDGTFTNGGSQTSSFFDNAAVGDFDGDGNLDFAGMRNFPDGTLTRFFGNGSGGFISTTPSSIPGQTASLTAADFNSDGKDDFAFISSGGRGNLVILPSTASAPFGQPPLFYSVGGLGVPSGGFSSKILAADFNADGKPDIGYTMRSRSRGVVYNTSGNAAPCLSIGDVTVTEGDSGSTDAVFELTLSAASTSPVLVNYVASGVEAVAGTDLEAVSGRLTIPAGQTSASVTVPILGDVADEFDETFTVTLSSPANAAIGRSTGVGTIIDNDAEPTITISDYAAIEGNFTQFVFNVNLSAASGKPISFRYTTADGTATAGSDYIAANNVLNIVPGATTVSANVTVIGDSMHELNETFQVNLTEPVNVTFADGQGVGTITNDDPVPTLSIFGGAFPEGDSETTNVNVTLQLSNPTYLPVTVNVLTSDGTAIAGQDYVASDTPVIIPPASFSFSTPVQIRGDVINEPNETFFVNIYNVSNATVNQTQSSVLIVDDDVTQFDFDNDGKADIGIFRPANGEWWYRRSLDSGVRVFQFGTGSDRMVPADYTGDGRTDIAVWRPTTGQWFVLRSENGTFYSAPFGTEGDVPVPGDYDNDNKADVAVYRPSTSTWYISLSAGGTRIEQFGSSGDIPVAADYDGDGHTDPAIFRPSNGQWWLNRSAAGVIVAEFGNAADKLVTGDYTGDGKTDVAFWRPSTGEWFVLRSEDFSYFSTPFGTTGDLPAPGDYDSDGKHDITVFRPATGTWYLQRTTAGTLIQQFGADGDLPITNAFVR